MEDHPNEKRPPDAIDQRLASIRQLTAVVTSAVSIPDTDVVIDVVKPRDIDALLDDVEDDPEQNLPYWAEIWPSGIALASMILQQPAMVSGLPVIELGCGIGITAVAAQMSGATLTVTDYSPHSLLLTELTCLLAHQSLPRTRQVNWRDPSASMLQETGDRWPVVLAADVLYEERDIEPVLTLLERIVCPNGVVLLAEPGRRPAIKAIHIAAEQGWQIETRQTHGSWPDPQDRDVVVSIHSMRPAP